MLKFYNTLSRQVEEFKPLHDNLVTMYTCGPTVYHYAHIGNLRSYLFSDLLKRTLLYFNYEVKQVINITDVGHLTDDGDGGEDKIEKSARLESKSAEEIADFYTNAFKNDIAKLNIIEPEIWAKASDHIKEQIDLAKKLDEKGYLYRTSDGMYFDTAKFSDYGRMAKLNLSGQEEGARVHINQEKRNPTDFAVWKFSSEKVQRQQEWESPWGKGFPGWHLECSAMSMKYLGETLDIHTGGIDHIPVHHTNEIAQSEAVTGKKFVNFWMHSEFLLLNDGKMSKSKGNIITLTDLQKRHSEPIIFRYYCLMAHYRSKLNFSWEAYDNIINVCEKFIAKFYNLGKQTGKVNQEFLDKYLGFVKDDLNMPRAMSVGYDVLKSDLTDADKRATLLEMDKIAGMGLAEMTFDGNEKNSIPEEVKKLVQEREELRAKGKYDRADKIRKLVQEMGYEILDAVGGTEIKKIN